MASAGRSGLGETFKFGVVVHQAYRDRGSRSYSVIGTGIDDDAVCLQGLALAATISPLPSLQFDVDEFVVKGNPGRKTLDDRREGRAVRFAGGQITEHVTSKGTSCR